MGERGAAASLFLLSLGRGNEQLRLGRPSPRDLTLGVCSAFQSDAILHSVAPFNWALCYVFLMSPQVIVYRLLPGRYAGVAPKPKALCLCSA